MSKDDLESRNEELTALNGQLQATVERQRASSRDLQNILDSTEVATLFLDANLSIRFFTPAAASLFMLVASDVGERLPASRAGSRTTISCRMHGRCWPVTRRSGVP